MISKTKLSAKTLALDIRNTVIHGVVAAVSANEFTILDTFSEPVPEAANTRDAQRDVLKAVVAQHKLKGMKAIISSGTDEQIGTFAEVMPENRGIDINQWAMTQLEQKLDGGASNYIADASISRVAGYRTIAYLKRGEFESRMSMVRDAGLVPLAFDAPILAWQRRLGEHFGEHRDGLLDLSERPTLYLFKNPVGHRRQLLATNDMSALAREIGSYLREMRRIDHDLTINTIAIHAPGNRDITTLLMELAASDRAVEFDRLSFETKDNPKGDPDWAFASALATWDIPGALGMRANLINADRRGYAAFGRQFSRADIIPGAASVVAAGVIIAATQFAFSSVIGSVNSNDASVNQELLTEQLQVHHVGAIQTAVERLRTIDRDRFWLDRSGRIVALRMVDLANAIPDDASISRMSHDKSGWRVEGDGTELSGVAQTQDALEKASPGQNVMMLDETHNANIYGFSMTISGDPTSLAATQGTGAVR